MLAIFSSDFDEERQTRFLEEIGIKSEDRGEASAVADLYGAPLLMDIIAKYGGIAILAHADTEKGFLYSFCRAKGGATDELSFSGKSLANIIKSQHLYGIQVAQKSNMVKLNEKLSNKDYVRNDRQLAFLCFSDYHGKALSDTDSKADGHAIGEVYSVANLTHISFDSIKMILSDPIARITNLDEPNRIPVAIIGCAISSNVLHENGSDYCFVRFNPRMNCLIGARGTGKSTILEIVQHIIALDDNHQIEDRFTKAVLYVSVDTSVYAISFETKNSIDSYTEEADRNPLIKVYKMTKSGSFKNAQQEQLGELSDVIALGFRQRQFYEYSKNPEKIVEIIDSFLKWLKRDEFKKTQSQIDHFSSQLHDILRRTQIEADARKELFCDYLDSDFSKGEKAIILNQHKRLMTAIAKRHELRQVMITELNTILAGKVKIEIRSLLPSKEYQYYTGCESYDFSARVQEKTAGKYFEYRVDIKKKLTRVFAIHKQARKELDFFALLLEKKYAQILNDYKSIKFNNTDLDNLRNALTLDELTLKYEDSIRISYNVNSGSEAAEHFKSGEQLSWGQKAVALLLLILDAAFEISDNRPLLMDQPEDDLDNSYIYNTLVREFRNSKSRRQIIISTHNANIPVTADAENIIVLKYDGTSGYVADNGSLDKPSVAQNVLEIMEDGKEAIAKREDKYSSFI